MNGSVHEDAVDEADLDALAVRGASTSRGWNPRSMEARRCDDAVGSDSSWVE